MNVAYKYIASVKAGMIQVKTKATSSFQGTLYYCKIINSVINSTSLGSCFQILL